MHPMCCCWSWVAWSVLLAPFVWLRHGLSSLFFQAEREDMDVGFVVLTDWKVGVFMWCGDFSLSGHPLSWQFYLVPWGVVWSAQLSFCCILSNKVWLCLDVQDCTMCTLLLLINWYFDNDFAHTVITFKGQWIICRNCSIFLRVPMPSTLWPFLCMPDHWQSPS